MLLGLVILGAGTGTPANVSEITRITAPMSKREPEALEEEETGECSENDFVTSFSRTT